MAHVSGSAQRFRVSEIWAAIFALAFAAFAMTTAEVLPTSMLPLLAEGLDASEGLVGQAITATAIAAIVISMSISRIVGQRDRRIMILLFIGCLALSNLGVTISQNVWMMLLSRMLLGAAIGIFWGLIPSVGLRLGSSGNAARGLSIIVAGASLSGVVSSPLAALIGGMIGWRSVYAAATVISVAALIGLIRFLPSMPPLDAPTRKVDLRQTFRLPGLLPGMIGMMVCFGGAQTFYTYFVPFLEDVTRVGTSTISIVLFISGTSGLAGNLLASRPLQSNLNGAMGISAGVLAITLGLLLMFGESIVMCIVLIAIWAFFRNIVGVGGNAWVAQAYPRHAESVGGLLVTFIQLSMMLGAMLGGVLIDNIGPKGPPTAALAILGLGAFYVYTALKPQPGELPQPAEGTAL